MAYIEVFKGDNPDALLVERLQHISQLHKQRVRSSASLYTSESGSELDLAKVEEEEAEKKSGPSTPRKVLSRQKEIADIVEEGTCKKEEDSQIYCVIEEHDGDDVHGLNTNVNNNSFAVGRRVIVQHKNFYLSGCVRFIGRVTFNDKEQIGIELDQPYGE